MQYDRFQPVSLHTFYSTSQANARISRAIVSRR
jgi:hypothetical protein